MPRFFNNFEFSLLNSPGFKEDSVREDLIMPLLTALGYSSSGPHTIERSKNLIHPFVYIGTKPHKIYIFPDYTLAIDSKASWILDAKAPSEDIRRGKHREQAYCYAMHKDIRVPLYSLCNGHHFLLFHVSREEPILDISLESIPEDLFPLTRHLTPKAILMPHAVDYWPDLGLHCFILGYTPQDILVMPGGFVELIARLDDESFSVTSGADIGGRDVLGSFDFTRDLYDKFLSLVPPALAEDIRVALKQQPYHFSFPERRVRITIRATLGTALFPIKEEQYIPFQVIDFESFPPP